MTICDIAIIKIAITPLVALGWGYFSCIRRGHGLSIGVGWVTTCVIIPPTDDESLYYERAFVVGQFIARLENG